MSDGRVDQLAGGTRYYPQVDPPKDPIYGPSVERPQERSLRVAYRDISIPTIQNAWAVEDIRAALGGHVAGIFAGTSQLWDSILGDARVKATLGARIASLLSRPVRVTPADDSEEAREIADAWRPIANRIWRCSDLAQIQVATLGMGFGTAEILWTDAPDGTWVPELRFWNARYTYYDFLAREYVAATQDGPVVVAPGSGKWLLHVPWGAYRGWLMGSVRGIAEPWALRHFSFRDMARFCEVHGAPWVLAETPFAADPDQRAKFAADVANAGAGMAILIGKGAAPEQSYGVSLVEAKDTSHPVFPAMIDICNTEITLELLGQNLTTEVDQGSQAAATVHAGVKDDFIVRDSVSWHETIYRDLAVPFADLNHGRPDLAPITTLDDTAEAERSAIADMLAKLGSSISMFASGGVRFRDAAKLRDWLRDQFGLDLPDIVFDEAKKEAPGASTPSGE